MNITINGNTQPASISAGSFSVSFPTGTIPESATPYTITYAYQGDSNYATITDTSQALTVNKAPATVSLSNLNQTYTGSPLTPAPADPSGLGITWTNAPQIAGRALTA